MRDQGCGTVYVFSSCGRRAGGAGRQIVEGRGGGDANANGDRASVAGGVSFYICAGVRGAERGNRQGYIREFVLWTGNWIYGDGGSVFCREHFRRSVQPGSRGGDFSDGAVGLAEDLDLSGRRICWRGSGGGDGLSVQSRGQ